MDNADKPGPTRAATSSDCNVCLGLCDMKSPRGYVLERAADDSIEKPFVYTYVHRSDMLALFASAEAGCGCCGFIYHTVTKYQSYEIEYDVTDLLNSQTHHAQLDDDLTATQLAELGRRERIYRPDDLSIHDRGRIVIQFYIDEDSHQWRNADILGGMIHILMTRRWGDIKRFHTPCTCSFLQDISRYQDFR